MSNLIFSVELDIPTDTLGDGSVPAVQRHSKKRIFGPFCVRYKKMQQLM